MANTTPTQGYGLGRRKQATATARVKTGSGVLHVNGRDYKAYFPTFELQRLLEAVFESVGMTGTKDVDIKVRGGGIRGQAEGARLSIARALVKDHPDLRVTLKKLGYLKRDARVKERKKYGKKSARRSPQWSKR